MNKTNLMRRIERERGLALEELLPLLFEEYRTNAAVAEDLGISSMQLSRWLTRLRADVHRERLVEHRTRVSFPEHTPAS